MPNNLDYRLRITPDKIQVLKPNEIFVFGSNSRGLHYGGAARLAVESFGAIMGQAYGLQGNSFAICSMDGFETMKIDIDKFIQYAKRSTRTFLVTEIGCGIAGYTPEEIAPLFKDAMDIPNIYLPKRFWDILNS